MPVNILQNTYAATTEITSSIFKCRPSAVQASIYIYATTAGTLDVDALMSDGGWRELYSNLAVSANTLAVLSFGFRVPILRVRHTPTSQPGTVTIDVAAGPEA